MNKFNAEDYIVYPTHGVGRIKSIEIDNQKLSI